MVGWYHGLNRHEFEQTPGDSERQGSLACYSLWGGKKLDMSKCYSTEHEGGAVAIVGTYSSNASEAAHISDGSCSATTGFLIHAESSRKTHLP